MWRHKGSCWLYPQLCRRHWKLMWSSYQRTTAKRRRIHSIALHCETRKVSVRTFRRVWHELVPFAVTMRPATDLCWVCRRVWQDWLVPPIFLTLRKGPFFEIMKNIWEEKQQNGHTMWIFLKLNTTGYSAGCSWCMYFWGEKPLQFWLCTAGVFSLQSLTTWTNLLQVPEEVQTFWCSLRGCTKAG